VSALIASGTRFRSRYRQADPGDGRSKRAGSFFICLDDLDILDGMARAGADVRKAEPPQQRSDVAFMEVDAKAIGDHALEIDAPPSHDAVDFPVWAHFDDRRQFPQLRRRQAPPRGRSYA
jgi:hypothetical protein